MTAIHLYAMKLEGDWECGPEIILNFHPFFLLIFKIRENQDANT